MARKTTTPISIGASQRKNFVDTAGWIAVHHHKDSNHIAASNYYTGLIREGLRLQTSDYVLDETITNLRRLANLSAVQLWWEQVKAAESGGRLIVHSVDSAVRDAAFKIMMQYREQDFSFTDCTSFVLAQREKIDAVFTFDHHFNQFGLVQEPG